MIRLNPASSSGNVKRRQQSMTRPSSSENGSSPKDKEDKGSKSKTSGNVDALFQELLGDDASAIIDDGAVDATGRGGGGVSSPKRGKGGRNNDLGFGDRHNNNHNREDDDGISEMSSVVPSNLIKEVTDQKLVSPQVSSSSPKNPPGKTITHNYWKTNSKNNKVGSNGKNSNANDKKSNINTATTIKEQEHDEDLDEDTYMTKPREIFIDGNNDDVSTLFQHHHLSNGEGVESYMGTFAEKRRNRRQGTQPDERGGGRLGPMMGAGNMVGRSKSKQSKTMMSSSDTKEMESRGTGATSSFQTYGVTSILEEIGVRPPSGEKGKNRRRSTSDDFTDDSGNDTKGHVKKSHHNSGHRHHHTSREDDRDHPHGRQHHSARIKRTKKSQSFFQALCTSNKTTMTILVVGFMFVVVQIPSVQKRDKSAIVSLNSRFRNDVWNAKNNLNFYGKFVDEDQDGEEEPNGHDERRKGKYDLKSIRGSGGVFEDTVGGDSRGVTDDGMNLRNLRGVNNENGIGSGNGVGLTQQNYVSQNDEMQNPQVVIPQSNVVKQPPPVQQQQPPQQQQRLQTPPQQEQQQQVDPNPIPNLVPPRPIPKDDFPARFRVFSDLNEPFIRGRDTPFFWHIPRSGGVIIKTMLSHCLNKTLATEVGTLGGHEHDSELKVVTVYDHKYVNVNIATPEGIQRAKQMGLVRSHLADTLVSPHVDLIPDLFDSAHRGRAFALFRNPIDRAASLYYYLKETNYAPLEGKNLVEYAKSELSENNWLVRILSDSMTGAVNETHLEIAKEVLRRKFVVGLIENKRGSFARFDHYFKWKETPGYDAQFGCRKRVMDETYVPKHPLSKDSEAYGLLYEQNLYDMKLYDYVRELFKQQSNLYGLQVY